jgi:DNA-binding NarL/FixJ family response regulator
MAGVIQLKVIHRNRLFRECLALVLAEAGSNTQFRAAALDHADAQALQSLAHDQTDVLLIDLCLPEDLAVELTQYAREHAPGAKVVMLVHGDTHHHLLVECFAAGAYGCVLEESSMEELKDAIRKIAHGEMFCPAEIVYSVFGRLAHLARESHARQRTRSADLTPRELEVVQLIAERLSNKQIARRLSLSLYTVKNHIHNIVAKLEVEDRHQAVEYARQHRWLRRMPAPGRL